MSTKYFMLFILLSCVGCTPTAFLPNATQTSEYKYKTIEIESTISELQQNLFKYNSRCGSIGQNATFRTFEQTSSTTAVLHAQSTDHRNMFIVEAIELNGKTTLDFWGLNWAFMEHFLNAVQDGACIDSYMDKRLVKK